MYNREISFRYPTPPRINPSFLFIEWQLSLIVVASFHRHFASFQRSSFGYHASRKASTFRRNDLSSAAFRHAGRINFGSRHFQTGQFMKYRSKLNISSRNELVKTAPPPSLGHSTLFTIPGRDGIIIQRERIQIYPEKISKIWRHEILERSSRKGM